MPALNYRDKRDIQIFLDTYYNNTYQFPDKMEGVAFDIGAHIGSASLAMAERGAKVFAFEPCKSTYKKLVENTKGFDVTCFNVGVGEAGERKLYIHDWDTGSNSLRMEEGHRSDRFEIVKIISFAEALKIATPQHIKLDCEGCEFELMEDLKSIDVKVFAEVHCPPQCVVDRFCKPLNKSWEGLNPNVYKLW